MTERRASDVLDLVDWRRRVAAMYAEVREAEDPEAGWRRWRSARDDLFRSHPQSPVPASRRGGYAGVPTYPYDPALRALAEVEEAEPVLVEVPSSRDGSFSFTRFARARFELLGEERGLDLLWLEGYGGGLFLPFRDTTNGDETYGGGRYLLDTVKGADLGTVDGALVLDFNFGYHPSCVHDPRWACPLAPPGNRLQVAVEAGERYG